MKSKNTLMHLVVSYNCGSEYYKVCKTLHERISFKGTNPTSHILNSSSKVLTKEQKRHNYECVMCEKGLKPFTFSDADWQDELNYRKEEEFIANCEAKTAWMYEF